jgi:phosphatidylserine/phosphatidylglycerophosphate/cardiolipin synthase-like enzyme
MKKYFSIAVILFVFLLIALQPGYASDLIFNNTPTQVCFSPKRGCTEAIVSQIDKAKSKILVQAYSFTSAPIAKALVNAHKRGVKVEAILDKSQRSERYTSATLYLMPVSQPTLTVNTPLPITRS